MATSSASAALSPRRPVSSWSTRLALAATLLVAAFTPLVATACAEEHAKEVVVYCALDLEHAQAILDDFTARTGIHVRPVADNEITKTVALTNQILLDRARPQCDVFWNNEVVNTIRLGNAGCLEPYLSPSAADIPAEWKDPAGLWTGFAARARIFIVNTEKCPLGKRPTSYRDYLDPARRGEWAIAKPVTGTTASHFAVLFDRLGDEAARNWWRGLVDNGAGLLSGNGPVMKQVRAGEFSYGFTDTDDFHVAWSEGAPVERIYPDQEEGGLGCLVLPNTVSLVKGAPHPDFARQFIDYVLSREVEQKLAFGRSAQIPVRADVPVPPNVKKLAEIRLMKADFQRAATQFDAAQEWLNRPGAMDPKK